MNPFVKICGIKTPDDALAACDAGADAIGLNFYAPSKRYVGSIENARAVIAACAGKTIRFAGVFVNPTMPELIDAAQALDLAIVQLHGDESPQFVSAAKVCLNEIEVWKAFRAATEDDLRPIQLYRGDAIVIDAKVNGEPGGTGQTFDWTILKRLVRNVPLVLSGGLNAGNVAAAIKTARPDWVDVASGVEDAPGRKSARLIREFVTAARAVQV